METNFIAIGVNCLKTSLLFYTQILDYNLDNKIIEPNIEIAWLKKEDCFKIELVMRKDMPKIDNNNTAITLVHKVKYINKKEDHLKNNNINYNTFILPNGQKTIRFSCPSGIAQAFIES